MLTEAEHRRAIAGGTGAVALVAVLILLPIAALLWVSPPSPQALLDSYTLSLVRFTLLQASLSTLLSVLLAIPVALALARQTHFIGRIWLIRLMAVPMGLPVLIGALGLIGIFGRQGILNRLLTGAGLEQPITIYGLSGILLAHVFFNLPLAARLFLAALERLPQEYWRLTASLGMKSAAIFRLVELPALLRVMPGAAGLIFMLCATSFTLVLILGGGPAATTLEVAIYQSLRFDFDPPRAVALSLLQIGLTTLILLALSRLPQIDADNAGEGRPLRRFDARGWLNRGWDSSVLLLTALFLLLPLGAILWSGFHADLARLALSATFRQALLTSLAIAVIAGFLSLATALGILHARAAMGGGKAGSTSASLFSALLSALSSLVLLVPPVVLGTGWFLLLREGGDVGAAALPMIAAINMLMALPFVVRVLQPALRSHRERTDRLAASLGISGWARWRLIGWPVLKRPLLTALSFAMALSLGDLGAVAVFGSQDLVTLPWLVYSSMGSYRTQDADGFALLLGLICLGLTILGTLGSRKEQRA